MAAAEESGGTHSSVKVKRCGARQEKVMAAQNSAGVLLKRLRTGIMKVTLIALDRFSCHGL
jgi:hypothetical protein